MSRATDLSKRLSRALRHEPWVFELELDPEGWVPLDELIYALQQEPRWSDVSRADIEEVLATASKQRHEIRDDKIRALYGHSVPGRVERVAATPPDELFHGTSPKAARVILADGLQPMKRQFVHMSTDREMATAVGSRKAQAPLILKIDAKAASDAGVEFYPGNDRVWLADEVPAKFISEDANQA